jgi:hypothetical protein
MAGPPGEPIAIPPWARAEPAVKTAESPSCVASRRKNEGQAHASGSWRRANTLDAITQEL